MARAKKVIAAADVPVHIEVADESPNEMPVMLKRSKYLVHVVGGFTVFAFAVLLGGMLFVSWAFPNQSQVATPTYSETGQ